MGVHSQFLASLELFYLMNLINKTFGKKDWTTAKAGYNEAIGLKSGEKYPKDQLALIEKTIADDAAVIGNRF